MTTAEIVKYALAYGIPVVCLLMFIRELIVSYFIRSKFESSVSVVLGSISEKISKIENIIDHNVNRIGNDIPKSSEISRFVSSSRARLSADRAYVLRFHDGAAFSTNAPVWKVSLTHESTDSATAPIAEKTKDILIANIIQIVSPVFDGDADDDDDGIRMIHGGVGHEHKVFRIDTHSVTSTPIRGFLLSRGIEHLFYTPIVDLNGSPIALFCIDFSDDIPGYFTDEFVSKNLIDAASVLSNMMS